MNLKKSNTKELVNPQYIVEVVRPGDKLYDLFKMSLNNINVMTYADKDGLGGGGQKGDVDPCNKYQMKPNGTKAGGVACRKCT